MTHGRDDLTHLLSLGRPDGWVTVQIQDLGDQIAGRIGEGQVLTLAPVAPLEGGADIYPAFVNGPFTWRTTNYLSPERQRVYGVVSPGELGNFLENDPPVGILTGFESRTSGFQANDTGGLEEPLIKYALDHNYRAIELTTDLVSDPVILWVHPAR